jgi:carbonic anhydrase
MVMKQPLQASAEQLAIFGRLYPNNARPVQPANNRLIKESR